MQRFLERVSNLELALLVLSLLSSLYNVAKVNRIRNCNTEREKILIIRFKSYVIH